MPSLLSLYATLIILTWLYVTIVFFISLIRKRNDVADIAWGLGFLLATVYAYTQRPFDFDRGLLVVVLVGVWALRLALHIYVRNRGKVEDRRYRAWREQWGRWFYLRSYLQIFILQGALMLVVVSPAVLTALTPGSSLRLSDILGVAIWVVGFGFEAIGDWQLARFKRDAGNAGKIIQTGLWRYSRHPNYFGEVTQWWGLWLIALAVPAGWATIIGPITITFLITKVSGIPMLEKNLAARPEFSEYMRTTSVFFPWPPKK
jgi:steroid 5-alpha reductase family enzyme